MSKLPFNPSHHTWEGAANRIHIMAKYKNLPDDVVEEIIALAKKRIVPKDVRKENVLIEYFNHALSCKVIKKFDYTNKEKQLLSISVQFLDIFLQDAEQKHKDIEKLHDLLKRLESRYHEEIPQQLEYAYKHIEKLTNQKALLCNQLTIATILSVFFARSAAIDKKLKEKIIKLSNKIHDDLFKTEGNTTMYQNSADICAEFYANIERQKAGNKR